MRQMMAGKVALCAMILSLLVMTGASAQDFVKSPVGAKHVILIGYDGYGGNYVQWDQLPNLSRFRDQGAWTLKKRSIIPSASALNWATILMGAGSELHGFRTWGSKAPDLPSAFLTENGLFPDIFYMARQTYPEAKLCACYSWDGIGYLFDKKAMNEDKFVETDEEVCQLGLEYEKDATLAFIYFSEPDGTGHGIGWGTQEYYDAVKKLDGFLGQLLDYLEANNCLEDTVVMFTSDHGGIEKGHGGETMEEMEAPFLILGCGVKPGEITDVVAGYDVAATIAWVMGITPHQAWRGRAITSAFGK